MPHQGVHGIAVTLVFDTLAQAQQVFSRLGDGGKVTMPMAPSFWARSLGMLVDRFGIPWIVNGQLLL